MTAHDPSIIEAVRRMKGEGVRNSEIAMACGLTESSVKKLCFHRGIKKPTSGRLELSIGTRMMEVYLAEARRRDIRFERLMHRLLYTIAHDNLFSAIIDDGK